MEFDVYSTFFVTPTHGGRPRRIATVPPGTSTGSESRYSLICTPFVLRALFKISKKEADLKIDFVHIRCAKSTTRSMVQNYTIRQVIVTSCNEYC